MLMVTMHLCYEILSLILFPLLPSIAVVIAVIIIIVHLMMIASPALPSCARLCLGNDELPQHRSILRVIHTLNSPKIYIRLLRRLLSINLMHWRGAQSLMWGTRGLFPPPAAMASYGCVGQCWPLKAYFRSTYFRNSK
jgi:hypothetical protein